MRCTKILLIFTIFGLLAICALHCTEAIAQQAEQPIAQEPARAEEGQPAGAQEQPAEEAAEEEPAEQELEPVPARFDFEGEELGPYWFTMAQNGKMSVTRQPADVRKGQGALQFSYTPTEAAFALIGAMPVKPEGPVRSLQFSFKTDELSPILFGVNEADGSSYQAYCYTPGGQWHDVLVDLGELILSEDTEDENANLDADQIATLIVADLCNLPGEVGRALGIKRGLQRMWLDDLALTEKPAPKRSSRAPDGTIIVDDFNGQVIACLPIGRPEMTLVPGPQAGDRALKVGYRLGGHRWVGFVAAVPYLDLSKPTKFCFGLHAAHRARLVAVLEERDGSKYETNVEIGPAKGWHEVVLPIAEFVLDPNTEDENGQVDLSQLRVIIFVVDTFNASVDAEGLGWYTISKVYFR